MLGVRVKEKKKEGKKKEGKKDDFVNMLTDKESNDCRSYLCYTPLLSLPVFEHLCLQILIVFNLEIILVIPTSRILL